MAAPQQPTHETFLTLLSSMYLLALITALSTLRIVAPYGRHIKDGWGPHIPARLGWIVMESPAVWNTAWVFSGGRFRYEPAAQVLLLVYLFHYVHRVVVYPFRARLKGKSMPLTVPTLAFLYNIYNGYLQGYQIGEFHHYEISWLHSPAFLAGLVCFLIGFTTNVWADSVLMSLRRSDADKSYKIPQGFLYEYISCPNYFGEILEWLGWAIMTWSLAGLSFFVYTCANLIPRALAHHDWYRVKFEAYPHERRAVIPGFL